MQDPLRNGSLTVIAALASALVLSGTASAQEDCPRGTLDKAYCDRNGDLTADLPSDPKKIINPPTLIFSYTPVEDSMDQWAFNRRRLTEEELARACGLSTKPGCIPGARRASTFSTPAPRQASARCPRRGPCHSAYGTG